MDDLKTLSIEESKKKGLSIKQRNFINNYACHKRFIGNATKSYIDAYGKEIVTDRDYKTAKASACHLLKKPKISSCIGDLLNEHDFTDEYLNKQLGILVMQCSNYSVKLKAVKFAFKMKEKTDSLEQEKSPDTFSLSELHDRVEKEIKEREKNSGIDE